MIYAASEQKFQSQCVALPLFCPQSTEQSDGRERGTLRGGGGEEKRRKEQLCRLGRRRDGFCQGQEGRRKDGNTPSLRNAHRASPCVL